MSQLRKFLISALALAAASVALAVPATQASAAGGPVDKILVWGDSMTQVWPGYLDALLPIPVEQHGVGADTIQQTQTRFVAWVNAASPSELATTGHLCWCGHTNTNRKNNNPQTIVPTLQAMAKYDPDGSGPRARVPAGLFMPIGLTNGPDQPSGSAGYQVVVRAPAGSPISINDQMLNAFGPSYAEVRRYLVTHGLSVAGITPTQEDRANIAADIPPRSLRTDSGGNPAHLNDAGRHVTAQRLDDLVRAAGWIAQETRAASTTASTSSMNPNPRTTRIRVSATVTNASGQGGLPTPTGSVQFSRDGIAFGRPIALNSSGMAISPLVQLAAGRYVITAVYSGDPRYASSSAPAFTQIVT